MKSFLIRTNHPGNELSVRPDIRKDNLSTSITQEGIKVLGALYQEPRTETKHVFLIRSHQPKENPITHTSKYILKLPSVYLLVTPHLN